MYIKGEIEGVAQGAAIEDGEEGTVELDSDTSGLELRIDPTEHKALRKRLTEFFGSVDLTSGIDLDKLISEFLDVMQIGS